MTEKYLLIGSGRVSSHFQIYFQLLGLPYEVWSRQDSHAELQKKSAYSTHILCFISDSAIEPFLREHLELFKDKLVVHASGSLVTPLAEGAHPLMTFAADTKYDLETYKAIPFILEKDQVPFKEIFPKLENPHFVIEAEKKSLYHALCVLSGNFTTLLWQKAFTDFEKKLALPHEVLLPYLKQVIKNLEANPEGALTGPLARRDTATLARHLEVLKDDPFGEVYRSFVHTHGVEVENEIRS